MGCWNKTCGISNLHIHNGQPVYVFVLEENVNRDSFCYSSCLYKPCLLPFNSFYNDYGAGENSSGIGLPYILKGLRENLVELEVGENEYHDIAVKRDDFDEDKFFQACHKDRLFVSDGYTQKIPVKFTMMRKDIVDNILEKFSIYSWKDKKSYTYADTLKELNSTVESYLDLQNKSDALNYPFADRPDDKQREISLWFELRNVIPSLSETFSQQVLRTLYGYDLATFIDMRGTVPGIVSAGDIKREDKKLQLKDFLAECLKGVFIESFMSSTRKLWTPGGHEGSQNTDLDGHKLLISVMKDAIDFEESQQENDGWPRYQT